MEFLFSFEPILPGIVNKVSGPSFDVESYDGEGNLIKNFRPKTGWLSYMKDVLDTAGRASAKAQGLSSPITTFEKVQNFEHSIYIVTKEPEKRNQGFLMGFLKVGHKKLFLLDADGCQNEVNPLCILDFYVPEVVQRRGHGLKLFEFMLKHENVEPRHLAIDRPSEKFLAFLAKHFGLVQTIPQVNNFVIYSAFFEDRLDDVTKKLRDRLYLESSPRPSPQLGRKNPSPIPSGPQYVATAAKQKSTLAQILLHDHVDESSLRISNASRIPSNQRNGSSCRGETGAAGLSSHSLAQGAQGYSFSNSAAKKDSKYSHSRLW